MDEETARHLATIEQRLNAIEERNRRVETHKAWETSVSRKISIVLLTYFVMYLVFWSLDSQPAWRNAIIPTLGFFLSTLSLPFLRNEWEKRHGNGSA